ncbi:alpha/beta hydrolase [Thalassotalea sp. G2M2-11]|uniref:alpha/beta fold hydrolase n=1 Tax=Thalassotalea sp. G2M2-11 TaxID=2787627 RepID=UPI0019D17885|nr:alpha/beta hydrolase [Thalassotalea sp. G2M2-11]
MEGVSVSGKGPVVVFLHSSLSSAKQWQRLAQSLSDCFCCINIDLLGYGRAPQVTDEQNYSFATEVARIKQILAMHEVTQPYHLVGHSCGGAIALKMAVESPENIASLTLYEPVAFHLLEQLDDHVVKIFADELEQLNLSSAAKRFIDYWNGDGFFDALPEATQQQMAIGMKKVNLDFHGIFGETYLLSDLFAIACPALILVGKGTSAQSKQLSENIGQHIASSELVFVDAGHMGPISHPQLVEPLISDFLLKNI